MDYADYDVNISLPQGWLVGATGELTNPNEVLSPQTRARLADARRGGAVVHVVRDQDRGAGAAKATMTGFDGVLTWRFRARNVRDFDWGASSKYLWDATTAVVGDREGDHQTDTTSINTFYRPDARRVGVGSLRRVRTVGRRVSLELSMAVSVAADDRARGAGVVLGDGVSDADVHRRTARHAVALFRAGP